MQPLPGREDSDDDLAFGGSTGELRPCFGGDHRRCASQALRPSPEEAAEAASPAPARSAARSTLCEGAAVAQRAQGLVGQLSWSARMKRAAVPTRDPPVMGARAGVS